MNKYEVFKMLKNNNHTRKNSIIYISDFLNINKEEAVKIYEGEYQQWLKMNL